MADRELSRSLPPCLQTGPRYAGREGLRFHLGNPNEGDRTLRLDDRPPLRNGLRKVGVQRSAECADDRAFPKAKAWRRTIEPALELRRAVHAIHIPLRLCIDLASLPRTHRGNGQKTKNQPAIAAQ